MILFYYFLNILIDINDEVIIGENTFKVTLELLFIITRHFLTHIYLTINMMYSISIQVIYDIRYISFVGINLSSYCISKSYQCNKIVLLYQQKLQIQSIFGFFIYTCYYHHILRYQIITLN